MSTDIGFDPYDSERTDALSPRRVRSMKPFLEQTVAGLLQRFADNGGGDFVRDVALPLPLLVLTELVGFTTDTVRQFREITEDMWKHLGAEADDVDFTGARRQIYDLMRAELRRERPADGFIASLRDAEIDGRALTEDEQISVLATLAVAGHETTMNSASTLCTCSWSTRTGRIGYAETRSWHPATWRRCCATAAPAQNFARQVTCPVTIADRAFDEGDTVLLSFAAANRDPDRFADPDHFDPDRDPRGHLGFGWRIHQCLGSALARAELTILLTTLTTHPPLRAAGEARWSGLQGGNHLGPTILPVRFATQGEE